MLTLGEKRAYFIFRTKVYGVNSFLQKSENVYQTTPRHTIYGGTVYSHSRQKPKNLVHVMLPGEFDFGKTHKILQCSEGKVASLEL